MYADRQRDKTAERQTDRETEGQRNGETDRQTWTEPVLRKIAISPHNDVCVCVCVCTYIHTYMQTNRETKRQREPARHVPSKMSPSAHTKVPTPSNLLNLNMPWYINTHTHTHTHIKIKHALICILTSHFSAYSQQNMCRNEFWEYLWKLWEYVSWLLRIRVVMIYFWEYVPWWLCRICIETLRICIVTSQALNIFSKVISTLIHNSP